MARLIVNEVIISYTSKLSSPCPGHFAQQRKALAPISKMDSDICTGISSQVTMLHQSLLPDKKAFVPPFSGVFLVLFPLAVAGAASGVSDDLHGWVVATLQSIGRTMGIRQAPEIIPRLRQLRYVSNSTATTWLLVADIRC
jgi:hypothetical protein